MSSDRNRPDGPERHRLKERYGVLFTETTALLFRHDPMEINYGSNVDEYDSEVGTILPRLRECNSATGVRRVVHEEFVRWFGSDDAGTEEHYTTIATEIWELEQRIKRST
jgi:hypothetical protein